MSRIGKQLIVVPNNITVELQGNNLCVKGPKGELKKEFHKDMKIEISENQITVKRSNDSKENRALHGLTRSIIVNMVEGVNKGFEKKLEIIGVGYRANTTPTKIIFSLGYSHPVEYKAPEGIQFKMDEEAKNILIVSGIDKQTVGETAAKIRSLRPPEPYKGKGIRYLGEYVARKAGKTAGSAS